MRTKKMATALLMAVLLALPLFLGGCGAKTDLNGEDREMMALSSFTLETEGAGDEAKPDKYIVFQMTNITPDNLDGWVQKLHDIYGNTYADEPAKVAFGICGPYPLYQTAAEMKAVVDQGFSIAKKYQIPVYFQVDDMGYWSNEPSIVNGTDVTFKNNTAWHEARSFTEGDYAKLFFNWGNWTYAPRVPALGVPGFQDWVAGKVQEGVIVPILEAMEGLKAENKEFLFAGVATGWESSVCDARKFTVGETARCIDVNETATMTAADCVIPFYTSIKAMLPGVTDNATLEAAALPDGVTIKSEGADTVPAADARLTAYAFRAIRQYGEKLGAVAALTKLTGSDYQIPRTKIFTHVIASDSYWADDSWTVINKRSTPAVAPIAAAVNQYATPGFTMNMESGAIYNIATLKARIKAQDPTRKFFSATEHYSSPNIRASFENTMANFKQLTEDTNGMEGVFIPIYGFDTVDPTNIFYTPKDFTDPFVRAVFQAKQIGIA